MASIRKIPLILMLLSTLFISSCDMLSSTDDSDTSEFQNEAELAALWLSGELEPPPVLTAMIKQDLYDIRAKYGREILELNKIHFQHPDGEKELLIDFNQYGYNRFLKGTFDEWDSLNKRFNVAEIKTRNSSSKSAKLILARNYNLHKVSKLYSELDDIVSCSPNGFDGIYEPTTIYPWNTSDGRAYLFREGDYMGSHFWYFKRVGAEFEFIGDCFMVGPVPEWWPEISEALNYTGYLGE